MRPVLPVSPRTGTSVTRRPSGGGGTSTATSARPGGPAPADPIPAPGGRGPRSRRASRPRCEGSRRRQRADTGRLGLDAGYDRRGNGALHRS